MAGKTKDILVKDLTELKLDAKNARADLADLRLDHSQFKLKNTRQIFTKRKEIARLLTAIRGKELASEKI